jgi:hypothetical protein
LRKTLVDVDEEMSMKRATEEKTYLILHSMIGAMGKHDHETWV